MFRLNRCKPSKERAAIALAKTQFYNQKNIDRSLMVLEATLKVLKRYEIAYYLDFGTLLGAVREKGLIPWDYDIDISLLNEEDYIKMPDVLKDIDRSSKELTTTWGSLRGNIDTRDKHHARGYKSGEYMHEVPYTSSYNWRIAKVNDKQWKLTRRGPKFRKGHANVDIFFKYEKDGLLHWMSQALDNTVPVELFSDGLMEVDFYHLKCTIPKNYDAYLTHLYGDWRTPHEGWVEQDQLTITESQS